MPGMIVSKAQWRKLAATLPEAKFKEMAEGVDFDKLPEHVENHEKKGKVRAINRHLDRLRRRVKR
jgi:hypothetical protein